MKAGACFLVLLLVLTQPALAQSLRVRSGEHDDFTRLVFDVPDRTRWVLTPEENAARIEFPGLDPEFDTSRVFDRIPRTRLARLAPLEKGLRLILGCDCEVSAFLHARTMLVVDIGAPSDGPRQVADNREVDAPAAEPAPLRLADVPENPGSIAAGLMQGHLPATRAPDHPGPGPAKLDTGMRHDLAETRQQLFVQFDRARTQGLLTPRMAAPAAAAAADPGPEGAETDGVQPEGAKTRGADAATGAPAARPGHISLHAQTSVDRDFLKALSESGTALGAHPGAHACPSPERVDVASWGDDAPFVHALGRLRSGLAGEFDRADRDAILRLARFYLHFGFGAEARQVLDMSPGVADEHGLLHDMADIVDRGHARDGSQLHGYLECDAPAALWAVLSHRDLPADRPIRTDEIVRAFNTLPQHLRRHLGPFLLERFAESGHKGAAEKILRILDRSEETRSSDSEIARLGMNGTASTDASNEPVLDRIVQESDSTSPAALVQLIDFKLREQEPVSYDIAQLAGAYAQEHGAHQMGGDLVRVYVLALASSGAFEEALGEWGRLSDALNDSATIEMRNRLLALLTANAPDPDFLRYLLSARIGDPAAFDPQTLTRAIDRVLETGFVAQAQRLAQLPADGPAHRDRALLRARISLERGAPRQAQADLLGLVGADANRLRAQARDMAGEHAAAYELFLAANDRDRAAEAAWKAQDWRRLAALEDTGTAEGSSVSQALRVLEPTAGGAPRAAAGELERNRELITGSEATRQALSTLLQAHQPPRPVTE